MTGIRRTLVTICLVFTAQTMITVLVPVAASQHHLGPQFIGILIAIPLAVGFVIDIPVARLSDTAGRRPVILAGSVIGCVGALELTSPVSVWGLVAGSLLCGVALSLLIGPLLALFTEVADPANHAAVQGYNGSAQALSALVGAAVAGAAAAQWGVRYAFGVVAASLAVCLVVVRSSREQSRPTGGAGVGYGSVFGAFRRAAFLLLGERRLRIAAGASVLYGLQFNTVGNAFVPVFLIKAGFSGTFAGGLLAVRSLVAAALGLCCGALLGRFGMPRMILIPNLIGIVGVAVVPLVAHSVLLVMAFVLQGVGVAFGAATVNLLVTAATSPSERAVGFSATNMVGRTSGVVLPILLGLLAALAGYPSVFIGGALVGVAILFVVTAMIRVSELDEVASP